MWAFVNSRATEQALNSPWDFLDQGENVIPLAVSLYLIIELRNGWRDGFEKEASPQQADLFQASAPLAIRFEADFFKEKIENSSPPW
ncbi:hypothetical protein PoB_006930500 [Plakobranchus ocellatus]|uniref:Bestrophin homolog n=1 Tax=Plakobranchus ocellatus TaxID=259542 RepID=A0AAV4DFP1_9GAST|nr:hypothetical protein PoB_006930500 [Plakobranchus ocellatus]